MDYLMMGLILASAVNAAFLFFILLFIAEMAIDDWLRTRRDRREYQRLYFPDGQRRKNVEGR